MDSVDTGENKYGKRSRSTPRKGGLKKTSTSDKLKRLDKLLQEKGVAMVPKGEWSKFISWLIYEHIGNNSPQHSAIFAFTVGYIWQKHRKTWMSRNVDNESVKIHHVKKLADDLRRQIDYHSYCYNALNWPEISDHDYDAIVKELLNLESKHPEIKQPAGIGRCINRWVYEVDKLLEANFADKGELQPAKTRRGKLEDEMLLRFMDLIPDDPCEVVADEDWKTVFSTFFDRHFREYAIWPACWAAFVAGAAWCKYRDLLDQ